MDDKDLAQVDVPVSIHPHRTRVARIQIACIFHHRLHRATAPPQTVFAVVSPQRANRTRLIELIDERSARGAIEPEEDGARPGPVGRLVPRLDRIEDEMAVFRGVCLARVAVGVVGNGDFELYGIRFQEDFGGNQREPVCSASAAVRYGNC